MKPEIDKPQLKVTASGVHYVSVSDIFRSKAGQDLIRQMAALTITNPKKLVER